MIGLDTNVFVRLFVNDNDRMSHAARQLLGRNILFVPKTVVLESVWILETKFGVTRPDIHRLFGLALGMPQFEFEDGDTVVDALAAAADGMEIEDALHLFACRDAGAFATFDKDLRRRAKAVETAPSLIDPLDHSP